MNNNILKTVSEVGVMRYRCLLKEFFQQKFEFLLAVVDPKEEHIHLSTNSNYLRKKIEDLIEIEKNGKELEVWLLRDYAIYKYEENYVVLKLFVKSVDTKLRFSWEKCFALVVFFFNHSEMFYSDWKRLVKEAKSKLTTSLRAWGYEVNEKELEQAFDSLRHAYLYW